MKHAAWNAAELGETIAPVEPDRCRVVDVGREFQLPDAETARMVCQRLQ